MRLKSGAPEVRVASGDQQNVRWADWLPAAVFNQKVQPLLGLPCGQHEAGGAERTLKELPETLQNSAAKLLLLPLAQRHELNQVFIQ